MYLDAVKGLAIFLMVFGHCIEYRGKSSYVSSVIYLLIYSFHMPLFALVSGYLFFPSVSGRNTGSVFIRQAKRFMVPVISWTVIYSVLCFFRGLNLDISGYILHTLWYLWAMFLCSMSVLVARIFFNDSPLFYALLFCALLFAPMAATVVFMYPYFAAGYLWHRENFGGKIQSLWLDHKIAVTICLLLVWLLLFQFYTHDSRIYGTKIYLLAGKMTVIEQFRLDMFRWAIGFAGSLAVMAVIKFLRPVKILCLIGANTLGIYIISRIIDSILTTSGGLFANFTEAVIITAICCTLTVIISRNKTLNTFLLGGR